MRSSKCACRGSYLEKFVQPSILLELYQHSCPAPVLYQLIRRPAKQSIDPTGFYRTLKKMEESGLISSRPERLPGKNPARLYKITDSGADCLRNWKSTLQSYRKDILELLSRMELPGL